MIVHAISNALAALFVIWFAAAIGTVLWGYFGAVRELRRLRSRQLQNRR
jgi:hypothetical protein